MDGRAHQKDALEKQIAEMMILVHSVTGRSVTICSRNLEFKNSPENKQKAENNQTVFKP